VACSGSSRSGARKANSCSGQLWRKAVVNCWEACGLQQMLGLVEGQECKQGGIGVGFGVLGRLVVMQL